MKFSIPAGIRWPLVLSVLCSTAAVVRALPAFPGAAGFGSTTQAGRGGTIIHVTTLADNATTPPTGSLRAAINTTGARIIVFDVSGIIRLCKDLVIDKPYCTIAGQTAPAPGVLLEGAGVLPMTNDVLIQHLAIRPSKYFANDASHQPPINTRNAISVSALSGGNTYNVVVDHVSMSWSTDQVCSAWSNLGLVHDVTFSNCIIAEALQTAGHTDDNGVPEDHAYGPLLGRNSSHVSMIRNILAFNEARNPMIRDDCKEFQILNNFIFHPGTTDGDGESVNFNSKGGHDVAMSASVRGNVAYLQASDTTSQAFVVSDTGPTLISIFEADNSVYKANTSTWYHTAGTPWNSNVWRLEKTITKPDPEPSLYADLNVPVLTGGTALEAAVVPFAGSRPATRDPIDSQILTYITNRTGTFIDAPADIPAADRPGTFTSGDSTLIGFPAWTLVGDATQVTRVLADPANPGSDSDGDGYTNAEEWLHGMAALEENVSAGTTLSANISTFDTFTDGNANGWNPIGYTQWTVASGAYRQSGNYDGARATLTGTNWTDQVVQAKVTPLSFNGSSRFIALYARHRDFKNSYYVTMRGAPDNKIEIKRLVDNVPTTLGTSYSFTPATGTQYTLRLEVSGTSTVTLKAYLNNNTTPIITATDASPPAQLASGQVAIGTYYATADFDDVFASPVVTDWPQVIDDFDDGNATGWSVTNGTWTVSSGQYHQTDTAALARAYPSAATTWSNMTVQADVRINSINGTNRFTAVHARFQDINNSYFLALRSNNTVELKKVVANTSQFIPGTAAVPYTVALGTWYTLRLEVTGGATNTTLKGYVNGQLVVQGTDSNPAAFTSGKAALGAIDIDGDYDDVTITSP